MRYCLHRVPCVKITAMTNHRGLPPGRGTESLHAPCTAIEGKHRPTCYVITGVSGSGKSTVGKRLAKELQCNFYDGDDYHPQYNIDKMKRGQPLTDKDREPWLRILAKLLEDHVAKNKNCVVACSCLKLQYRRILSGAEQGAPHTDDIAFVLLQPSRQELERRVQERAQGHTHFMPASLLESQLAALEVDPNSMVFGALQTDQIIEAILESRL